MRVCFLTVSSGGPRVSVGTTGVARLRYRVCAAFAAHRIPVARMSALQTNPILAAPAWTHADRRISAGFIVEDTAGARGLSARISLDDQYAMPP